MAVGDSLEVRTSRELASLFAEAHDIMRNKDGLQPQEAFDELLKYLFYKESVEFDADDPAHRLFTIDEQTNSHSTFKIREHFSSLTKTAGIRLSPLLSTGQFNLSDQCLLSIQKLLLPVRLSSIPFDIRSAALRQFLNPELRRGLGIYLTPENVVRMMVEALQPSPSDSVLDPACGSGTFLVETIRYWLLREKARGEELVVSGNDKSPRMLMLASLNLGHIAGVKFDAKASDFLATGPPAEGQRPKSYDMILTNPPFGVTVDSSHVSIGDFSTCHDVKGKSKTRYQSEFLFLEQALKYLKPGGLLGIVLPRSVLTNQTHESARAAIDRLGTTLAIVTLPPETFHSAGTQTTTCVLFVRKFLTQEPRHELTHILYYDVQNVGCDSTGRACEGDELPAITQGLSNFIRGTTKSQDAGRLIGPIKKDESLSRFNRWLAQDTPRGRKSTRKLGDILVVASLGKTPPRSAYSSSGLFLLKVGNLSGRGIDWSPRERNFVSSSAKASRALLLQAGDLVLTSSAHSLRYIAKKVDIVGRIPIEIGGSASFVGEVMMLRPKKDTVDPYRLLAYLRSNEAVERIQQMVRGQTAHLHPDDMLELQLPDLLWDDEKDWSRVTALLQKEVETAEIQSELGFSLHRSIHNLMGAGD